VASDVKGHAYRLPYRRWPEACQRSRPKTGCASGQSTIMLLYRTSEAATSCDREFVSGIAMATRNVECEVDGRGNRPPPRISFRQRLGLQPLSFAPAHEFMSNTTCPAVLANLKSIDSIYVSPTRERIPRSRVRQRPLPLFFGTLCVI